MRNTLARCFGIWLLVLCSVDGAYRRVCYYTNWAQYRNGVAKFVPSDIDPFLCTHIIYAFGKLHNNTITNFEWNDETRYAEVNAMKKKNPQLKTLLAMGGWTAGSKIYSEMAATPSTRRSFIDSAIEWLRKYDFDGLDMDWEYPANRGGAATDFQTFPVLLKELMTAFTNEARETSQNRLLLTAAVGAGKATVDTAYDIPEMSKYLDFIALMTYDLRGGWETKTGFHSPLYPSSDDTDKTYNVDFAAEYWHSKGAPKEKLVVGLATYGRSFTLKDANSFGVGALASGPGPMGKYVSEAGFLPYYDICERQSQSRGKTYRDPKAKVPYFVQNKTWVGFDDPISIYDKVRELIVNKGYSGAMIWALDFDDFNNICGQGRYPLSNVMKYTLKAAENGQTLTPPPTDRPIVTVSMTTTSPGDTTKAATTQKTNSNGGSIHDVACDRTSNGLYRYHTDCSKYIQCVNGKTYIQTCPPGLEFNTERKNCDWPRNTNCVAVVMISSTTDQPKHGEHSTVKTTSTIHNQNETRLNPVNASYNIMLSIHSFVLSYIISYTVWINV